MTARKTVVTDVSTRSPRSDWARPRSVNDVITGLERNGFVQARGDDSVPVGIAFVRVVGLFALRVTIANSKATLQVAQRREGGPVSWRPYHVPAGNVPWQVAHEALELLATLDVDTPVRWG